MQEDEIRQIVLKYYEQGFHCAESIAHTIHELFPEQSGPVDKVASGFCGGIGRCHEDVCGALSGGVIALGSMYGREKGEENIDKVVALSLELRRRFVGEFGTTVCRDVIENSKKMPGMSDCKDVTSRAAWILYRLIGEIGK
jgi:C_GCAxxG_C_C family probable redox protein